MKRLISFVLIAASLFLTACNAPKDSPTSQITLKVNVDSIGKLLELNKKLAADFEKETNIKVEFVIGPESSTERLAEYQRFLRAKSPDIDVYLADVIWPGLLGEHFEDLSDVIKRDEFFPAIADNNTVDGKLVFAPFYSDAPMLYYRTDLLEKYGYSGPPKTWDEMSTMAKKIMDGERAAGNDAFQGFVFQGAAYEGLTCNALEWQKSNDGGDIVAANGDVEVNTKGAAEAFTRARGWIGTISPQGVLTYKEEESRLVFQQGNAAFLRNWPYVWALASADNSAVKGKIGTTVLPAGSARSAATLGGWNLAVSKYGKHIPEAKKFVAFMTSESAQSYRALEGGYLPNRPAVYANTEIMQKIPYFANMKSVFENAVARPSLGAGRYYNEVSSVYFNAVHSILNGDTTADKALAEADAKIKERLKK